MIKGVGVAERYHLSKAVTGKMFLCYTVPGNQGTHDKTNQIRKSLQEAYLNTFFWGMDYIPATLLANHFVHVIVSLSSNLILPISQNIKKYSCKGWIYIKLSYVLTYISRRKNKQMVSNSSSRTSSIHDQYLKEITILQEKSSYMTLVVQLYVLS